MSEFVKVGKKDVIPECLYRGSRIPQWNDFNWIPAYVLFRQLK
jgi:hypothetical protein